MYNETHYEASAAQTESRPDAIESQAPLASDVGGAPFVGLLSGPAIQEQLLLAWQRARASQRPFCVMFLRAMHRGDLGPAPHILALLAELHGGARVGAHDRHALLAVLPDTDADGAVQIARTLGVRLSGRGRIACGVAIHPDNGWTLPQLVGAAERAARRACTLEPIVLAPHAQPEASQAEPTPGQFADVDPSSGVLPRERAALHDESEPLVAQRDEREPLVALRDEREPLVALRDERELVLPLAHEILAALSARWCISAPRITDEASALLREHDWPGDRAELRNVIERALTLSEDETLTPAELPDYLRFRDGEATEQQPRVAANGGAPLDLRASLLDHEAMLIRQALQLSRGNQRKAAQLLNLPLRTFERKLRHLGGRERLMAS